MVAEAPSDVPFAPLPTAALPNRASVPQDQSGLQTAECLNDLAGVVRSGTALSSGVGLGVGVGVGLVTAGQSAVVMEEGEDEGDLGSLMVARGPINTTTSFVTNQSTVAEESTSNGAVRASNSTGKASYVDVPVTGGVTTSSEKRTANNYMFINTNGFMGAPKLLKNSRGAQTAPTVSTAVLTAGSEGFSMKITSSSGNNEHDIISDQDAEIQTHGVETIREDSTTNELKSDADSVQRAVVGAW